MHAKIRLNEQKGTQTITFEWNDTFFLLLLSYSFHFFFLSFWSKQTTRTYMKNINTNNENFDVNTFRKLYSLHRSFDICVCRFLPSHPISVLCFYSSVFHCDLHPFYSPFELLCFSFDAEKLFMQQPKREKKNTNNIFGFFRRIVVIITDIKIKAMDNVSFNWERGKWKEIKLLWYKLQLSFKFSHSHIVLIPETNKNKKQMIQMQILTNGILIVLSQLNHAWLKI